MERHPVEPVDRRSPAELTVSVDPDHTVRIGWHEPDWFGPGRLVAPGHVDPSADLQLSARPADTPGALGTDADADADADPTTCQVLRIEARRDLDELRRTSFDQPSIGWPVFTPADREDGGIDPAARALAFLGCEFALPTRARADLDGWATLPGRPPTAWPLLVRAGDGRTILIGPIDHAHEQIIGLGDGTLRAGWHGDLDSVPGGFATELAVIAGYSPRACIERWARMMSPPAGRPRRSRYADALATRPSYWTDNGAAYWYRTEPGLDPASSIVAAVEDLRRQGVGVGAVQLDSWFYTHLTTRPFDTDEWEVPPSPMLAWEERPDALPLGIEDLRDRVGGAPLVAHIRHLAADAPLTSEVPVAFDGEHAMPTTPEAYERWLDQCLAWGVETFEHDWLVEAFHRSRWVRERPGRAAAWQQGLDNAAAERGLTLQWCMGTPADLAVASRLPQVTSVRTSGDHGYIASPGQLWAWFLTTNTLARVLGLTPFKDVFRTDPDAGGSHGEVEALLSVLSTGPVGLGDRVGRHDLGIVQRTCRADGVLVKPSVPIAAVDRSLLDATPGRAADRPVFAECWSDHPAGRWTYLVALNCRPDDRSVHDHLVLTELGAASPTGRVMAWDWRTRTAFPLEPDDGWDVDLGAHDWAALVLAPLIVPGLTVFGDVERFAPAGDARLTMAPIPDGVRVTVKGADELVTITGWASGPPTVAESPTSPTSVVAHRWDHATGIWEAEVRVDPRGWSSIEVGLVA